MKPVFGIFLSVLSLLSTQAQTQTQMGSGFCQVLADLKVAADDPGRQDLRVTFPDAAALVTSCGLVRELGGARAVFCTWEFSYRAGAAEDAFETLALQVKTCSGDPMSAEAPVNHPDSYHLLTFSGGASVGLKDKVALGETHVILRVQF